MSLRFLAGLALALARARAASAAAPRWTSSPPLGWNPCNGFQCHMSAIGEPVLREIADAIAASGLRDAGYTLFSLDDGWSGPRDPASGALTANASAFPSGTLAPLAAHVAALGLELGAYADRGGLTCEKLPGSLGREALDAATLAGWGVVFLKEDSCNASEIEAALTAEYGAMAAAAAESGLFLSVCGWAPTYAGFGALDPPIGGAWRLGPDAGPWPRFLIGLEGAAGASAFAGPGRGWPDLDMLAGNTGSVQEIFRLSAAAVVGSVLLLSWDVRNASASDLPLSTYLNPELIAIHQDAPAAGALPYYARVLGGPATGAAGALPPATGVACDAPAAQWRFDPAPGSGGGGTLESLNAPAYCLAAWDLIPGGSCKNPVNAYLVPCANASSGSNCPLSAFTWLPGGPTANDSLTVQFGAGSSGGGDGRDFGTNPWPGSLLTASGVPGALFLQPRSAAGAAAQRWRTSADAGGPRGQVVTLQSGLDGLCLGAEPAAADNVWARWLSDGSVALLLVNLRAAAAAPVACDAACLAGLAAARGRPPPAAWRIRDVHARSDNGTVDSAAGYLSPPLEPGGGSLLLRISPV